MATLHFNWIAIVVAAVVNFAVGGIWYSPPVFGKRWSQLVGKRPDAATLSGSALMTLIAAILLAVILSWTGANGLGDGLLVALIGWLGFAGTAVIGNILFERNRMELALINGGNQLLGFLIMGAILGAWT